jgi:hypothetical protein
MSCQTCRRWTPPIERKTEFARGARVNRGICGRDGQLSHPGYHCDFYLARSVTPASLGLTEDEITWIRAYPNNIIARHLLGLYRSLVRKPMQPKAHDEFERVVRNWRAERLRAGVTLRLPVTRR